MNDLENLIWSLIPTIVLALAFWYLMRGILHQDRRERKMYAKYKAQEQAKLENELGISFDELRRKH